jgi:hypothetical protein
VTICMTAGQIDGTSTVFKGHAGCETTQSRRKRISSTFGHDWRNSVPNKAEQLSCHDLLVVHYGLRWACKSTDATRIGVVSKLAPPSDRRHVHQAHRN